MGENINRKRNIIYLAFKRHIKQRHNADFEVCRNSVCKFSYGIEEQLYKENAFPFIRE